MPMLGDMLATAQESTGDFHAWLERSNPDLAAAIRSSASAEGMTPTGYVRAAMADFNRFAAEEDWATLISTLKETDDPGTACLLGMVHWRLTVRGCDAHAAGTHLLAGER